MTPPPLTYQELDARFMRRWNENRYRPKRPEDEVLLASSAPQPTFTSRNGCLVHLTRFHTPKGTAFGVCGTMIAARHVVWVDPATVTFGCHLCVDRATSKGRPTHHLIPDTGCNATEGQRFLPKRLREAAHQ